MKNKTFGEKLIEGLMEFENDLKASPESACSNAVGIAERALRVADEIEKLKDRIKKLDGSKIGFRYRKADGKVYEVIGVLSYVPSMPGPSDLLFGGIYVRLEDWQIDGLGIPSSLIGPPNHLLLNWEQVRNTKIYECFKTFDCNAGSHSDACPASIGSR